MAKCPQCGNVVESGMKFCGECGIKIPESKKCPQCGGEFPMETKFCGECGHKFSRDVTSFVPVIGDKNVIAGDVNITTTNYINQDETKQVVKCVVCGRAVAITSAFPCSKCGEYVCFDHYVEENRLCSNCHSSKVGDNEAKYLKELKEVLEDGIIDQKEFELLDRLRKRLGISAQRAMELQTQMKHEVAAEKFCLSKNAPLMAVEKTQFERAKNKLYDEGMFAETLNLISSIYDNHTQNEEVLSVYLTALIGVDEAKVRSIVSALPVDFVSAYLALVDIEIRKGDMAAAEAKLLNVERRWPDNFYVKCRRAVLMYAAAKQFGKRTHLAGAIDLVSSLVVPQGKLEASWMYYLQYAISQALGDDVPVLTAEFCRDEGVYFAFVKGNIIGLHQKEPCEKSISKEECRKMVEKAKALYDDEEYEKAFTLFEKAATAGDSESMDYLATMYRDGEGAPEDCAKAEYWMKKAIAGGWDEALYHLAWLYLGGGEGLDKNVDEAMRYMRLAASKADRRALDILGDCCRRGVMGFEKDFSAAIVYYKRAAEAGSESAMMRLADIFREGEGAVKDCTEAVKWYRKAADQGCDEAQYWMGTMYRDGEGVAQDYAEAVRWFCKSAEQGNAQGQAALGIAYVDGYGVKQDYTEAIKWFSKAAEQGEAVSQYRLGMMYLNGTGVKQDYAEAVKWYRKAADQGSAEAQYRLGERYHYGQGVNQDYAVAAKFYHLSAEQGDLSSQLNLGWLYFEGKGVKQDYIEAAKWLDKSAKQGNHLAQALLGRMYLEGKGVQASRKDAIFWLEKAAAQGNKNASAELAKLRNN